MHLPPTFLLFALTAVSIPLDNSNSSLSTLPNKPNIKPHSSTNNLPADYYICNDDPSTDPDRFSSLQSPQSSSSLASLSPFPKNAASTLSPLPDDNYLQ